MGIGAILIGVALTVVVAAYLARPFRVAGVSDDQAIEAWVARVQEGMEGSKSAEEPDSEGIGEINFCPQCGRKLGPGDRFCARCGTQLRE